MLTKLDSERRRNLYKVESTVQLKTECFQTKTRKKKKKSKNYRFLNRVRLGLPLMGDTGSFEKVLTRIFLPWTNNGGGNLAIMEAIYTQKKKL